jgi:hypothetical protein
VALEPSSATSLPFLSFPLWHARAGVPVRQLDPEALFTMAHVSHRLCAITERMLWRELYISCMHRMVPSLTALQPLVNAQAVGRRTREFRGGRGSIGG